MDTNSLLLAANGFSGSLVIWGIVAVFALVLLIWAFNFLSIFIRAAFSGAPVGFFELIALKLRKVPVGMVVDARITAVKSGLNLSIDDLSTHYLAGGNVEMVVLALIAIFGLSLLSCNIACSGSEGLAYAVFFLGLGAVIFGLVRWIRHIKKGVRKTNTTSDQGLSKI